MRPYEILLVILAFLAGLSLLFAKMPRRIVIGLGCASLLLLILHSFLEGPHWQMAPAYLAALLPVAAFWTRKEFVRRLMGLFSMLFVFGACAFSLYLPMFHLPDPTGPHAIGTQILPVINPHPHDPSFAAADGTRPLMIQVWYPAASSHHPRAPYRILRETTLLSSYQSVLWTHARWNAPFLASAAPAPILILNPAWNGRRTYYMYLVEELVSHGYVVVGVDHTGNSGPTAFPDGHVSQPMNDPLLDFSTRSWSELNLYGAKVQATQAEDDRFVLDQLERWSEDEKNFYYRQLDLTRVAVLGHSFGGSVSLETSLEDARFRAALDMDGSLWGPVQQSGTTKPFMMIEEEYAQYTPERLQADRVAAMDRRFDMSDDAIMSRLNGYRVVIHGSTHTSFTDRSLFSPFKQNSGEGSLPAQQEYRLIRAYALAFFNKTLKGDDPPLLHVDHPTDPAVTFTVLHRPGPF